MTEIITAIILACQVHGTHQGDSNWKSTIYNEAAYAQKQCIKALINCVGSEKSKVSVKLTNCLKDARY